MQVNLKSLVLQLTGIFTIFALALFIPAGTIAWIAGWIFLALFFGFALSIFSWLYRHNPGLLRERMRLGASDQQAWDWYAHACQASRPGGKHIVERVTRLYNI
jgi:hypothetical protein